MENWEKTGSVNKRESEEGIDLAAIDLSWLCSLMRQFAKQSGQEDSFAPGYKKLTVEDIEAQTSDILLNVGLSLEVINEKTFDADAEDDDRDSPEVRVNLSAERGKFVEYLRALSPDKINASQIDGLITVISSLEHQLLEEYDLSNPDAHTLNLLVSLSDISKECYRLDPRDNNGLGIVASNINEYAEMTKGKHIKEFILAYRNDLTEDAEGFRNPTQWHNYLDADSFHGRLEKAVEVLEEIKTNPNAEGIFTHTLRHMMECLLSVKVDLTEDIAKAKEDLVKKENSNVDAQTGIQSHLDEIKEKLKIVEEFYEILKEMEE